LRQVTCALVGEKNFDSKTLINDLILALFSL